MFYKNENLNTYKSQWRYYFKEAALFLSLQIKKDDREDIWKEIISTSLSSTVKGFCSKSTSTLNYQEALKESDFHQLENNHQKIAKKWLLKSGRNVEDIIYDFAKDFKYEHPAHSYILDLKTADWESYFSAEELVEVKSAEDYTFNRTLPENLNTMLMLLNGKSSFREIYNSFKNLNADPVEDPEEFWLKRSVVDFTLLFTDNEEHEKYTTEQELLDDVYSFIKNSKKISGAKATKYVHVNAVSSSAEYKNDTRSISSKERISRQASGDRPDLCFSYLSNEIGCLEIGLEDHGANGTKEINESSIKLPMMMKNFFTKIYNQYDFPTNDVKVVGIVISGTLEIELD
ncbi:hypothetical protein HPULCUR_004376 [Helicostylum pulchrum]|uniref:Uncharacterized protein n=1 Tax=Helicostylum pulchrum TaxID=562976 RepID=A0ABP9XY40_9FUNG